MTSSIRRIIVAASVADVTFLVPTRRDLTTFRYLAGEHVDAVVLVALLVGAAQLDEDVDLVEARVLRERPGDDLHRKSGPGRVEAGRGCFMGQFYVPNDSHL